MTGVSLQQMIDRLAAEPTLVSFPTDTVPALATKPEYAELIYAAKQRPPEKPLILMGATLADLLPYVSGNDADRAVWQQVTDQHWPGQLTLVLPASDHTPRTLNPLNTGTLGIRVPNHPIALALLTYTGPLATTSANLSGQPPLISSVDIARTFPTALTLATNENISQNISQSGTPSTVVKWTGLGWQVLRQGKIKL